MDTHPPHPALVRVALHRLQYNLSYDALAAVMAAQGCPVKARALHLALTHRVTPLDRTLYRIEQFATYLDATFPLVAPVPVKRAARRRRVA
jgi:hypothetical protein